MLVGNECLFRKNVEADKSIHLITVEVLPAPWSAESQDCGGGGGSSPCRGILAHWSPTTSHPCCLLEKQQEVTRLLQGFSFGCLFCLSVSGAAALWHQPWLPDAPQQVEISGGWQREWWLTWLSQTAGGCTLRCLCCVPVIVLGFFLVKGVLLLLCPCVLVFQPLIMTFLGTKLAVKDWISSNVFLSNQESFWSGIWCTDH